MASKRKPDAPPDETRATPENGVTSTSPQEPTVAENYPRKRIAIAVRALMYALYNNV